MDTPCGSGGYTHPIWKLFTHIRFSGFRCGLEGYSPQVRRCPRPYVRYLHIRSEVRSDLRWVSCRDLMSVPSRPKARRVPIFGLENTHWLLRETSEPAMATLGPLTVRTAASTSDHAADITKILNKHTAVNLDPMWVPS